jgi:hypothetical protein
MGIVKERLGSVLRHHLDRERLFMLRGRKMEQSSSLPVVVGNEAKTYRQRVMPTLPEAP